MRIIYTLLLLTFFSSLAAQTTTSWSTGGNVDYEVQHDVIDKPWAVVNFDFFQMDMNTSNIDGASFNFALRGYADPIEFAGIDYTLRRSWLTGQFSGANTDIEFGGHYYLIKSEKKNKKTKVILRQSWDKDYSGPQTMTVVSTKSIQIPANRLIYRGVRAGLITKSGPLGANDIEGVISADVTLRSTGFYAGVLQKSLTNIFINTKQYGEAFESAGRDIAIDLLFYPVNSFDINDIEGIALTDDIIEEELGGGNIGFRVVYDVYQIEKKKYTGKTFGLTKRFEAGYKPFQGIYFGISLGWTVVKSKFPPF